ncbi:ribosome biogenesis regulatory protein-domain-containing protein [Gautieria morchelliformis]|nr:ribosome biogenesis regulatory protein-domain-containing protein [Gautieria morchelliformis]
MDVSSIIASEQSKHKSIAVEKEIPLEADPGLLTVTDPNPLDYDTYTQNSEEFLQSTARDGCQVIITSLFSLPIRSSADGPLAMLPSPTTQLPRSKPLPKPKPPTKWEKFAAAKGIQQSKRDRKVFDEEKQEWVNRWGRAGKNHEKEEQWITELPDNADPDFDPAKAARDERKNRIAKNEKQRLRNIEHSKGSQALSKDERKKEIERTVATNRISTASMGKFDKRLDGESKLRGVKRKFDPNEASTEAERKTSLAIVSKLDGANKRPKQNGGGDDVLNVRKAIRSVSKGKGAAALATRGKGGKRMSGKGKSKR